MAVVLASVLSPASIAGACPAQSLEPVTDFRLERFYTDARSSQVRADIRAANRAQSRPLKMFLNRIADVSDRAVLHGDRVAAECGLNALLKWTRADAMAGPMPTKQSEHHRKWALSGLALAYLKLKPFASLEARAGIEPWLQNLAGDAQAVFADGKTTRNNHYYWLGLAVGAVGLATDMPHYWDAARVILERGLDDIDEDGHLPMEMARGRKALHYHVFAVTPLAVLTWLTAEKGQPVSPARQRALTRLVESTLAGVRAPDLFSDKAGTAQDLPSDRPNFAGYGWPALLTFRPSKVDAVASLPAYGRRHRWLGGDIRALMAAVQKR
ncbi:MAG: alginate lyase family protein [Pseudomonadota bacterium]